MEQVIASLIEKSLIGGAFIYMLHFFLGRFATSLEGVSDTLGNVVNTLNDISNTMKIMDTRMEGMERRIQRLEDKQ